MRADPSHWLLAAILLLAGAHMVMNPDSFTTLAQNLTDGIRNFERTLHAPLWRDPWRRQWRGRRPINISPSRTGIRAMGLLVIAVGLLAAAIS
jgi:hypothetical protein